MKKSDYLNFLGLILAMVLLLFSTPAQAYVYDNFDGSGINTSLWSDRGLMNGLFTQPDDGYLHYYDATGGIGYYQILRSAARQTTPFFVSMQYIDFHATNYATGPFEGSGPILWIGNSTNSVRLYEYIVAGDSQGFRAIKRIDHGGGVIEKAPLGDIIPTTAANASLGIYYDGTYVSFWYDEGSGWREIPLYAPYAPGFTDPYFFIQGYNEYGTYLSFKVDQVQLNPVPLPAGVWLLGSGMVALAGWRRFKKG